MIHYDSPDAYEPHTLTEHEFTPLQLSQTFALSPRPMRAELTLEQNVVTRNLVARMRAWFAEQKKDHLVIYPATWWDHLKERWWPQWLLDIWPVRYHHEVVTAHAVWPNFPVMPTEWGKPIVWVTT